MCIRDRLTPSINKSIKDAPLYDKLIEYKGNSHKYLTPRCLAELEIFYGVDNVSLKETIYKRDFVINFLDKREENLLNFALIRWGIIKPKKVIVNSTMDEIKVYKFETDEAN